MKTYKGFDKDLKCRGFQYEIGKEYEKDGDIKACNNGFHACEHPLDCFGYYAPAQARFCEVEQSGAIDKDGRDTKVASSKIKIGAELNIAGVVKAAIEYTKKHSEVKKGSATGNYGASSATGYKSASSAENKTAVSVAWGYESKAKGILGAHIVCAEWKYNDKKNEWVFKGAKLRKVDGIKIKADTYYSLINGKFTEVSQ